MSRLSKRTNTKLKELLRFKEDIPWKARKFLTVDPALVAEKLSYETLAGKPFYGPKTINEIADWLRAEGYDLRGMPEKKEPRCCPHCGKSIAITHQNGAMIFVKAD